MSQTRFRPFNIGPKRSTIDESLKPSEAIQLRHDDSLRSLTTPHKQPIKPPRVLPLTTDTLQNVKVENIGKIVHKIEYYWKLSFWLPISIILLFIVFYNILSNGNYIKNHLCIIISYLLLFTNVVYALTIVVPLIQ